MGSIDLTAQSVPSTTTATMTNANECYDVMLPRACGSVILTPITNDAMIAWTYAASIASLGHPLTADVVSQELPVKPPESTTSPGRVYLESAGAGTVVVVSLLPAKIAR